jgi:hypothetical protein
MLEIVLLAGKFAFLIVLYLFIYRVIRSATRELRMSAPVVERQPWSAGAGAAAPGAAPALGHGGSGVWTLVVRQSPTLSAGTVLSLPLGSHVLAGRSSDVDIHLDDTFVSSKHALFQATNDGLVVEDLHSTNGTQVNGSDVLDPRLLQVGDRVEVGDTVFQVEVR